MKRTKKQLIERIAVLERDIEYVNEYYIHRDQVDNITSDAIDTYEQQRIADLRRNDAEDNRKAFRVIRGAA